MQVKQMIIAGITGLALVVSACSQNGGRDGGVKKSDVGTLGGAIAGAWVGSNVGKGKGNIVGIAAGTLLGGYLGNQVGASLDKADLAYYQNTAQDTLENAKTGASNSWRNPDSGNHGTITPTRTYQAASGSYCREYTQTINVGGKAVEGYGTACRQPDGSWEIQK